MAAMTSKFNFECVIQYYTDQWCTMCIRSKFGNYKTTLRTFELKSETRFEKQPETESNNIVPTACSRRGSRLMNEQ